MPKYRHETFKLKGGYGYRILEGDREVVACTTPFLHKADADRVGSHFASDDDLEVNLRK